MDDGGPAIRPGKHIRDAFTSMLRRPFAEVLLLTLLIVAASTSIGSLIDNDGRSDYGLLITTSSIFFGVASIYLQIAVMLAAGSGGEPHGADAWIKAALRHRCFWRYVGVSILAWVAVLIGALAFVIGAIVVGAILFVSQPAVVLERKGPVDGLRRSADLTRPARRNIAVIFAVLSLPGYAGALLVEIFRVDLATMAAFAFSAASGVLGLASSIAVTRVFVTLGGAPSPPLQTLLYKAKAGTRS